MTPQSLPLFGSASPKPERAALDGYRYGDQVLLHDERNPGHWQKARVALASTRHHTLTLRVETPPRYVVLQMPEFAHKLRRP